MPNETTKITRITATEFETNNPWPEVQQLNPKKSDRFFGELDEALEDGVLSVGDIVHPCTWKPLALEQRDVERMLDNHLEHNNHHEDEEFECVDELMEFIKQWNDKQGGGSYFPDESREIVIDQEFFDKWTKETGSAEEETGHSYTGA